jgi:hypothetical protein
MLSDRSSKNPATKNRDNGSTPARIAATRFPVYQPQIIAIAGKTENRAQKATISNSDMTISPAVPGEDLSMKEKSTIERITRTIAIGTTLSRIFTTMVTLI